MKQKIGKYIRTTLATSLIAGFLTLVVYSETAFVYRSYGSTNKTQSSDTFFNVKGLVKRVDLSKNEVRIDTGKNEQITIKVFKNALVTMPKRGDSMFLKTKDMATIDTLAFKKS